MKHSSKRTIAGLMAMLMVLAVVFSIPTMTMNQQTVHAPNTNLPSLVSRIKEVGPKAETACDKYGLSFTFYFHPDKDDYKTADPLIAYGMPSVDKRVYDVSDIKKFDFEQIDFNTFMKSDEWDKIKTTCYQRLYEIENIDKPYDADNYIVEIDILPADHWVIRSQYDNDSHEYKSVYGLLDGIHTVILRLPDDYVDPSETPEPTPTPVQPEPPVTNDVTLAPTIQVNNKPMSVKHSTLTVTINGVPTELDAIVLTEAGGGAHTYYKLRDVGDKVGFDVNWTPETGITVDTRK